jgi:hypothetical protein
MKKRYLYACLFAVPGFFIALIVAFITFGSAAGVLWLFVYGDNSWPAAVERTIPVLFFLIFLALWAVAIVTGFAVGRRHEQDTALNRKHLLAALGMTIAPVLIIVLHQLSVGNIGPQPDGLRCSEYCREQGYAGSGMPPRDSGDRSCHCYDTAGTATLSIPLDSIGKSK